MSEPDKYVEIAAQIWCQPGLSHKEMDCELAYAFAAALREQGAEIERLRAYVETDAYCSYCGETLVCDVKCTFAPDDRMTWARAALAGGT
jgi:hypothetical protein